MSNELKEKFDAYCMQHGSMKTPVHESNRLSVMWYVGMQHSWPHIEKLVEALNEIANDPYTDCVRRAEIALEEFKESLEVKP